MVSWPAAPTFASINTYLVTYTLPSILEIVNTILRRRPSQPIEEEPEQSSGFFKLPGEMRQAIYEAAILDESDDSLDDNDDDTTSGRLNLLQTCRQVKMEAEPIRYQRPQSFSSQARLFQWLDRSRTSNLERVRTLSLHLTDIDLTPVRDLTTTDVPVYPNAYSMYQEELAKLAEAFRCLPNLSSLTIIPPKDNRSALVRNFYFMFLAMLPTRCPKLTHLEVHDTKDVQPYIPALNSISNVIFTEASRIPKVTTPSSGKHRYITRLSPATRLTKTLQNGGESLSQCHLDRSDGVGLRRW